MTNSSTTEMAGDEAPYTIPLLSCGLLQLGQGCLADGSADGSSQRSCRSQNGGRGPGAGGGTSSLRHPRVDHGDQRVHHVVKVHVKSAGEVVEAALGAVPGVFEGVTHVVEEVSDALDETLVFLADRGGGSQSHKQGQTDDGLHDVRRTDRL